MRDWRPLTENDQLPRIPTGTELIDSHCHLDFVDFDRDRDAVLTRARDAGVSTMVTIGASGSPEVNHRAVALAERFPEVFATVGIHPHEARVVTDQVLSDLSALAAHPRVVGIGETGLDYHYEHSPRPIQQEAFRRFIALARAVHRPLVVHLRAADDDAIALLRDERAYDVGGVIHCFSSDAHCARAFLDLGFFLSFSGIATFKTAEDVRGAAVITPTDRMLIETDAPFLAPVPFRGRRNEPALVAQIALTLARVRKQPIEELAAATTANARRLFALAQAA